MNHIEFIIKHENESGSPHVSLTSYDGKVIIEVKERGHNNVRASLHLSKQEAAELQRGLECFKETKFYK